jgi:N-acetylmuramoyl-L-alanine amidase
MSRAGTSRLISRRDFLKILGVLVGHHISVHAQLFPGPPTPPAAPTPVPRTTPQPGPPSTGEPRQYFVPAAGYHELPANCYAQNLIVPQEIILHWDGNQHGRALWLAPVTFDTLRFTQQSSHFAVDYKRAWQLLPMYQTVVQQSYGAKGYNWESINIEMAGTDFDLPENQPPETEVQRTLQLVSLLMDFYWIDFEHVVGHYERDPSRLKRDPGVKFLAAFRQRLLKYRTDLAPNKRRFWVNE